MTGIIILAAGESSRLGQPKQNLIYNGKTLLQITIDEATSSACEPIILVLGANTATILNPIKGDSIQVVHNTEWQQGMSTSIHAGLRQLKKTKGIERAIIVLCDQPFVNAQLINKLIETSETSRKGIVACDYNNTLGVPVLFNSKYFTDLMALKGHEGAKKLLSVFKDDIASVHFADGAIDIDTMSDYKNLLG